MPDWTRTQPGQHQWSLPVSINEKLFTSVDIDQHGDNIGGPVRGNSKNFDGKIDILKFTCLTEEVWLIQSSKGNWKDEH